MTNDQLVLDLDFSAPITYNGKVVNTNLNLSNSLSTISTNWDSAVYTGVRAPGASGTITIGSQTITEDKLKVLDDVVVGMQDWQEEVNKKLAILQPNPKLENQWSELKELREQYVNLERELQEKSLMWDILKD